MWMHKVREISKEGYEQILKGEKAVEDFFNLAETAGYGAIPSKPFEKDGKYYIPYGISDSCD